MKERKIFKELLLNKKIIISPGCHDPLSAKIVEHLGFDAVYLGGYAVGAQMGITEPLTTLTEMALKAKYISDFIKIPLIVDADAGFGGTTMIHRMVKDFEKAGVTAIHIEDQVVPKKVSYHKEKKPGEKRKLELISVEEMVVKIKICLETRFDENFLIIARTDAGRGKNESFQEAIDRANIYAESGADLIMVFPRNMEEIKAAPKSIKSKLVFVGSEGLGRPVPSVRELLSFGYKIVIYPTTSILIMTEQIIKVYSKLRNNGCTGNSSKRMENISKEVSNLLSLDNLYHLEEINNK